MLPLRQIFLRLPQPLNRPVDSLADRPPVEVLLPAEPLEGNALDQVIVSAEPEAAAPAQLGRFVAGERGLSLASAAKVAMALGLVLAPRR